MGRPIDARLRIGGGRIHAARSFDVRSPYSGDLVGVAPVATEQHVSLAITTAKGFIPRLTRYDRHQILQRTSLLLKERQDEAARLILSESGLCYRDAVHEIGRVRDVLSLTASEALREDGQVFACDVTPAGHNRKSISFRVPLEGVIAAVTPFNHPMNQVAHKVAPAIATNNRVIVKPSEKTPLSAFFLADLLYEAGLPPEMLQILTGDAARIVGQFLSSPSVELFSFTGGVEVGRQLASSVGYRRAVLELGGNDALIVMDDADVGRAADLAVRGSFANSGQRCTAVKRVLVHAAIAARFTEMVMEKTRSWIWGDPASPDVCMGTVINAEAATVIQTRVTDAVASGARLLAGNDVQGAMYAPTVLDRVRPEMDLVMRETFGPVLPIIEFSSVDEAIAMANHTRFALSAGVCSDRFDCLMRFTQELKVGTVNLWEAPGFRSELTPFGGTRDSGLGLKEGVLENIRNYTTAKVVSLPWG